MGTLGVAMMVKNEAKVLKRALHSTLDMVSEIVVLDTGSKDDTVEIAQGFTKNVFHQSWADNFSLHRNKSFSYIKNSDWILQIDADDLRHSSDSWHIFKMVGKATENRQCCLFFNERLAGIKAGMGS